ncbi:MAG TPA: hypothetical protein VLE46_06775 [Nitrospira sp.]|nr:hypothetical protein [Nitrospira sp.]
MSTLFLLDILFLLIADVAAVFAFGIATSRFTGTFKVLFFLFFGFFIFTLLYGYLPQTKEMAEQGEARTD